MAIWYPRYLGDYAKSTSDLSTLEHGILTLLLDYYYANGPMPQDWYRLYRVTKAGRANSTRAIVRSIVERYFAIEADLMWHNKRADQERLKMSARSDRAKGLVQKRWLKSV